MNPEQELSLKNANNITTSKDVNEFFKIYFDSLTDGKEEVFCALHHLPLIAMDKQSFLPLNNSKLLIDFFKNLIKTGAGKKSVITQTNGKVTEITELSQSMVHVKTEYTCLDQDNKSIFSTHCNFNIMRDSGLWRITVFDFENHHLPSVDGNTPLQKSDELDRLIKKHKLVDAKVAQSYFEA